MKFFLPVRSTVRFTSTGYIFGNDDLSVFLVVLGAGISSHVESDADDIFSGGLQIGSRMISYLFVGCSGLV